MNKHITFYKFGRNLMKKSARAILILIALCTVRGVQAQDTAPDFMRSTGKIYVVAAVTIVILITLFIYLVILDRKISRLEKRHKNE